MTKLLSSLAVVGLVVGCLVATELVPSALAADAAKGRVYLIGVPGATWGSCPAVVRETISSLPGVAEVTFDRDTLTAIVTMKDDKCELTKKAANKALLSKGDRYKVDSFKEKKK